MNNKGLNIIKFVAILLITSLLHSCFEEEQPMSLPETQGDIKLGIAHLTENYTYQVFYNFEDNIEEANPELHSWDLAFSCLEGTPHIRINTGISMKAANTGKKAFNETIDVSNLEMNFDNSNNSLETLALKNAFYLENHQFVANDTIFVIDLGKNQNNEVRGYKKVKFLKYENDEYIFQYDDLENSTQPVNCTIPKDVNLNYQYFSFENGLVKVEPQKERWDIQFTSYLTMLPVEDGGEIEYLVRGVLLNPFNTKIVKVQDKDFYDININDTSNYNFVSTLDLIGHDWKEYSIEESAYTIVPNLNFIIKTSADYYYKIRFVDFYNDENQKGFPKFEFARL